MLLVYGGLIYHSLIIFLAPIGAQGVTMSVCQFGASLSTHSNFIFLARIFMQSVSQQ